MQYGIIQFIPSTLFRPLGRSGFRCGNIAEHKLGQLLAVPIPPALQDILYAAVDLRSRFIWEGWCALKQDGA